MAESGGEMAERTKAVDSKSAVGQLTGGSNPSLSATLLGRERIVVEQHLLIPRGRIRIRCQDQGEVRERLNRRAWRARGRLKRPVGSNPTLSAQPVSVYGSSS